MSAPETNRGTGEPANRTVEPIEPSNLSNPRMVIHETQTRDRRRPAHRDRLSVGASYYTRRGEAAPSIVTGVVTRGPIVTEIAATGTLEAVTTVQVGSQVSGTIQELNADFNSIVRKGQVLARLDPSLFQTQVDSAARQPHRAREADLQRAQVALADAQVKAGPREGAG